MIAISFYGAGGTIGQEIDPWTYVEGSVTDEITGEPIEDAWVYANGFRTGHAPPPNDATDENGFYRIKIFLDLDNDIDIFCMKDGYHEEYSSVWVRKGETATLDIEMEPVACMVKGYVRSGDTGEMLPYAYIEVYPTEPGQESYWARTDEAGYFETDCDPGIYKLVCRYRDHHQYVSEEFVLEFGDVYEAEIEMYMIQTGLFGTVSSTTGQNLEDLYVRINTEDGHYAGHDYTDSDGYYEIRVEPGTYWFRVDADDHFMHSSEVEVEEDGLTRKDVILEEQTLTSWMRYIIRVIKGIIGVY